MHKLKLIFISLLEKFSKSFLGALIKRIPGTSAISRLLYEVLWSWATKSVMEIEGSKMCSNPRAKGPIKAAIRSYIRSLGREKLTTKLFKEAVKDKHTVVDIGANLGYFTLLAARLVGEEGKVYAFEPEPQNYNMLLKNIALNEYNNVIAEQKAVSNRDGVVKLYLCDINVEAHTLRECHDDPEFNEKRFVEVESVTLDGYFEDKNSQINVIKIDCEGAEAAIISGADRIIRDNDKLKLFLEFWPSAIRKMGYSPEELAHKLLENYGFSMIAIDELYAPAGRSFEIKSVDELMNLCQLEKNKAEKVNLFLERE